MKKKTIQRRVFLKGALGLSMALPFMDYLHVPQALAAGEEGIKPRFFVVVRNGNGVAQWSVRDPETERFWPTDSGKLTKENLQKKDAKGDIRAVGELADYADKLLAVGGTAYNFGNTGCAHSAGGNQCLTNSPPSPGAANSRALGESIDNYIQRTLCPNDPTPLVLKSGRTYDGSLEHVLSYSRPLAGEDRARLRAAEINPWKAYKALFGMNDDAKGNELANRIAVQRLSVNDMLREQIQNLKSSKALSQADQNRLQLHQQSIRDLELKMLECNLPEVERMKFADNDATGAWADQVKTEETTKLMMDIIALAFSCDLKRAATLQIGTGNDQTTYDLPERYPFHWISHRIKGNGARGSSDSIQNSDYLHYQINRIQARWFKYLLDRLSQYTTNTGTLLDDTVALWTNDLATGFHGFSNLPNIIAGSGGGYLKTGYFIDARDTGNTGGTRDRGNWVSHGQLYNTILNAVGVGEAVGAPVTDFGHKGSNEHNKPKGGEIPGMKA